MELDGWNTRSGRTDVVDLAYSSGFGVLSPSCDVAPFENLVKMCPESRRCLLLRTLVILGATCAAVVALSYSDCVAPAPAAVRSGVPPKYNWAGSTRQISTTS